MKKIMSRFCLLLAFVLPLHGFGSDKVINIDNKYKLLDPISFLVGSQTRIGEKASQTFSILVGGNANATFDPSYITGSSDFKIGQNDCVGNAITTTPYVQSCYITVEFTPKTLGRHDGVLHLSYYGTNYLGSFSETVEVLVHGFAVQRVALRPVCASIISPAERSLREQIPIVGTDLDLYYSSENVSGKSGMAIGFIPYFNPEGWSISRHHYYNSDRDIIYLGDGTSYEAKAILKGSSYFVVSKNGDEVFEFTSAGRQLNTRSSLTGVIKYTFSYNSSNYLISINDNYSNSVILNRNSSNKLSSIVSAYGVTSNISIDSNGLISEVENPKGESYSFTYKSGTALLETFQKPGGQISTFTYDADEKLTKDQGHGGNFWSLLQTNAYEVSMYSALNREQKFNLSNNTDGSLTVTVTEPTVYSKVMSTDTVGNTSESAEGVNVATSFTNDERFGSSYRRVSSEDLTYSSTLRTKNQTQIVTWPSGVTADWFNYSTITSGETVNSQTTTSVFDAATKTSTTTTPEGATSSVTVNSNEMVVSSQTGSDTAWSYSYDTHGRISQIIQGTNNGLTYAYNSSGYLQSITNLRGEVVSYVYDLAGRVTQVTLPDSRIITYSYDSNGNLTSVTPPSKPLHGMSFNAMELISTYSPPALTGLTTKDTTYSYNLDKQLTQITRPTGDTIGFTYSSTTGLLTTTTIAAGNFSYTYLSKNRISQANSPDDYYNSLSWYGTKLLGDAQWKTSTNFLYGKASYTYDNQHRISSRTFRGNSATNTFTRNYTFNNDSQITQAGSLSLTYTYPSGRLNTTSIDKISDSRTYDSYGNIQSYTAVYTPTSGSPQTLYSYTLSRDSMGRISGKSETVLGVTDAYTYSYDTAGRLTAVLKNGSAYSSYVYDSNGNRTSGTTAGTAFIATYDDQDRILTYNSRTYSYNANGDLTHIQWSPTVDSSYVYDALGDLRQATLSTGNILTYGYDGLDRRVHKLDGTALKYHYIFEDGERIAGHVNINGVIQREYIYATNFRVPDYLVASGVNYRLLKDHLGSIRLVVKTDDGTITQRLDYNDLGEAVTDTNAGFQAFGFAGGIYDGQTKFVKFGDRDYDPRAAGRWTTKDPIRFNGGDTNLYGYVLNDPINFIDPSGRSLESLLVAGAVLVTGKFIMEHYLESTFEKSQKVLDTQIKLINDRYKVDHAFDPQQCPIPSKDRPVKPKRFSPFPHKGLPDAWPGVIGVQS